MNHVVVILLCFASVVVGAFLVACRNYLARVKKEAQPGLAEKFAP